MPFLTSEPLPPMRPDLEGVPVQHEGQPMVAFSDALGLDSQATLVPAGLVVIASLFDGKKTISDIRSELTKHQLILTDLELQQLAEELERAGLLDTDQTRQRRLENLKKFRSSAVRPFPKTRGIPENALEAGAFMGKFLLDEKGPQKDFAPKAEAKAPLGLLAPHIDLFRGGPAYAWAYQELSKREKPDVIVALGVAHLSPNSPWVFTRKAYETPFGPVLVDNALYDDLKRELWYDVTEEEWVHAREHSLEFQALWLKYLYRADAPAWVPVLHSTFERFAQENTPSSIATINEAIEKMGQVLLRHRKAGKTVMVLAGVDFAHVGRRFGDEEDMTDELREKIMKADKESIDHILNGRADDFYKTGVGDGAWRKICGLSATYTALRLMTILNEGRPPQGRLLAHDQADDPAGGTVSFASVVFN